MLWVSVRLGLHRNKKHTVKYGLEYFVHGFITISVTNKIPHGLVKYLKITVKSFYNDNSNCIYIFFIYKLMTLKYCMLN